MGRAPLLQLGRPTDWTTRTGLDCEDRDGIHTRYFVQAVTCGLSPQLPVAYRHSAGAVIGGVLILRNTVGVLCEGPRYDTPCRISTNSDVIDEIPVKLNARCPPTGVGENQAKRFLMSLNRILGQRVVEPA